MSPMLPVIEPDQDRGSTPLLVVGHGTRSPRGARQFAGFVRRVAASLAPEGIPVGGGLIELAPPPLSDAVSELVAAGHRNLVAVPLMLVAAGHAKGDIPAALMREKLRHPGLTYRYARSLGPDPRVLAAVAQRLDSVLEHHERAQTHVVLVGRGSTDPDANAEIFRAARLFAEGRGLAGVEASFVSLAGPGVPAVLERCRKLGASTVVVLPFFMFDGVLPDRVTAQACAWAGEHPGVEVRVAGLIGDCDLLAEVVVDRFREALYGRAQANCDACMYRVALPGFEYRVGQPQTPHDHPHDSTGHHHT